MTRPQHLFRGVRPDNARARRLHKKLFDRHAEGGMYYVWSEFTGVFGFPGGFLVPRYRAPGVVRILGQRLLGMADAMDAVVEPDPSDSPPTLDAT